MSSLKVLQIEVNMTYQTSNYSITITPKVPGVQIEEYSPPFLREFFSGFLPPKTGICFEIISEISEEISPGSYSNIPPGNSFVVFLGFLPFSFFQEILSRFI